MSLTAHARKAIILVGILVAAGAIYVAVETHDKFGTYHDDAIYVTTARSLATGRGYRILSLPYEPAQTKYPPAYPFVLSLIWRLQPQFPDNLTAMTLWSVAATIAFLALTWFYLVKEGYAGAGQALTVVGLTAFNPRTVILASGIYSEMTYAVLSVMALMVAEKYSKESAKGLIGIGVGVLAGVAFLTRTSGIALLAAIAVYLAWRDWKHAVLPVVVGGAIVAAWVVWCNVNKTLVEGVNTAYYTSYLGHLRQVMADIQLQNHTSFVKTVLIVFGQNLVYELIISIPVVCSGLPFGWLQGFGRLGFAAEMISLGVFFVFIAFGFLSEIRSRLRLLHVYVLAFLGVHLFWLPGVAHDRFLMPLLPFFLLFALKPARRFIDSMRHGMEKRSLWLLRRAEVGIAGVTVALITGITMYGHMTGLLNSFKCLDVVHERAREDEQALVWIKSNAGADDVLLCYRDPMYYLYSGRKAVRSLPMNGDLSRPLGEQSLKQLKKFFFRIIEESDGRYVVLTVTDFDQQIQPQLHRRIFREMIESCPERFERVHDLLGGGAIYRVRLDRPVSNGDVYRCCPFALGE